METKALRERFKALSDKKEMLTQEKIQIETRLEVARTKYKELSDELKLKYKAQDLVEAQKMLESMTAEVERKLTEAESKLYGER